MDHFEASLRIEKALADGGERLSSNQINVLQSTMLNLLDEIRNEAYQEGWNDAMEGDI